MSDKPVTPTTENPEALTLAFWECGHVEVDRGVEHPCDRDVCSATYASYAPVAAGRAAASPDPPDAYTACVEALAEWWTGEATAAEVTGWMNGALQAARLPELDREAAISMCNMVMADLGDECDYGAVVSNVLRVAFPAASPDERLREAERAALIESIAQTERFRGGPCLCSGCVEKRADAEAVVDAVLAALAAADRDTACTDRENTGPGGAVTRGIVPSGTDDLAAADREKPGYYDHDHAADAPPVPDPETNT